MRLYGVELIFKKINLESTGDIPIVNDPRWKEVRKHALGFTCINDEADKQMMSWLIQSVCATTTRIKPEDILND